MFWYFIWIQKFEFEPDPKNFNQNQIEISKNN